jgi:hypothetical protein
MFMGDRLQKADHFDQLSQVSTRTGILQALDAPETQKRSGPLARPTVGWAYVGDRGGTDGTDACEGLVLTGCCALEPWLLERAEHVASARAGGSRTVDGSALDPASASDRGQRRTARSPPQMG